METTALYEGLKIPQATEIQRELRAKLDVAERPLEITTIGGADISLNLYSTTIYAGMILLSFPQLRPLAYSLVKAETRFPYVPGYLAFREVPALVKVWEQMTTKPDVLVVDGHGIAHPRRMGIAAHFGALTGQPAMGCAKKILFGKFEEPTADQGSATPIMDKDEQIGYAYRSKSRTAPVFVSPGHLMGLTNSLDLIRQCTGKYRIPELTRLAHELVNRFRKGELPEGHHLL
jgi:deoxyribonuclease V